MISINAYKLSITPYRQQQKSNNAVHNINQNYSQASRRLSAQSFGIAPVENNLSYMPNISYVTSLSYVENMSNCTYTDKKVLDTFIVGDNIDASSVDIKVRKHIDAQNNLKAKSLEANDYIYIGSNADIKGKVRAKTFHIEARDNIKAKSLHANTSVWVGENAQIEDGILAEKGEIIAQNGLCTDYLYAGGNIRLGSVNKLLDIFFNNNSGKDKHLERTLILDSNDINSKNNKKINIHLSDNISILTIKTSSEDPGILKKFVFKTSAKPTY
ncbi:MAG: hypothetical protein GX568_02000, partial [Candidatus Gastranaerophilales bacterium]|nr:hypothetical protein [Candidatus Gastranaerophilales bacterium]